MNYQINKFINEFCENFEISKIKLKSQSRKRDLVDRRMLLCYILRRKFDVNYKEIGSFVNRHHASIIHYIKLAETLINNNAEFRIMYDECMIIYKTYSHLYESKSEILSNVMDENTRLRKLLEDKNKLIYKLRENAIN